MWTVVYEIIKKSMSKEQMVPEIAHNGRQAVQKTEALTLKVPVHGIK